MPDFPVGSMRARQGAGNWMKEPAAVAEAVKALSDFDELSELAVRVEGYAVIQEHFSQG
jgi:hypothetical protein